MAGDAEIRLKITTDTAQASAGLKSVAGDAESFGSRFKSTFAGVLAAGVVQNVARQVWDFGKQSVAAYEAAEQTNVRFRDALSRIPGASDAVTNSLAAQARELSRTTTYSAGAYKAGIANLAVFGLTGDQLKTLTPLVADYATKTGQDLPSAAESIGKALLGQGRALKSVGIDFKDTGSVAGNFAQIVDGLQSNVGGLATAMGTTTAGKMAIFNNQVGAMKVALGGVLVQGIQPLLGPLTAIAGFFARWAGILGPFVVAIIGAVAAIMLLNFALGLLGMNPVGAVIVLIVVAIAVLIAAVYLLVTNWTTIWNAIRSVTLAAVSAIVGFFAMIWQGLQVAFNWVAANWPLILAILTGPIGMAVFLILTFWNQITAGVAAVVSAIAAFFSMVFGYISAPFVAAYGAVSGILSAIGSAVAGLVGRIAAVLSAVAGAFAGAFNAALGVVSGIISAIVGVVGSLVGRVAGAVAGVVGVLTAPFHAAMSIIQGIMGAITSAVHTVEGAISMAKGVWNAFAGAWNSIHISIPKVSIPLVGDIGGGSVGLPRLPMLAGGAYVTRATLAVIGEGRGPELVAPEQMLRQIVRDETGARYDQLVRIDAATFNEPVTVDLLAKRLAWQLRTAAA